MIKKLAAFLLACILAMGLSIPALAINLSPEERFAPIHYGVPYFLYNMAHQTQVLNVDAANFSEVSNSDNVMTWPRSGDLTQQWYFVESGNKTRISCNNSKFCLNIKRNSKNCDVVNIDNNNPQDYEVTLDVPPNDTVRIIIDYWGYVLNATNTMVYSKGYNCNWATSPSSSGSDSWILS